jgi:hypothetical protein
MSDVAGADFGGAGCCRGAIEPFGVDSEPTVAGPAFFDETDVGMSLAQLKTTDKSD